ncbi:hypothetical protein [Nannocystis pusilla]|uniref:Uncharacterized protein n=1 Tax=Nannocystis pusilla TaxID=889268 RepID=A0ABS7TXT5_9BACT|nr:hypothetical protein [Nannocystis pusilla]MBZ5713014.1 hypothetical protein [Nannocystis pusilla]
MKSDHQPVSLPRAHVSTSGTFAAVPQGFRGADGSLAYALKPEFTAVPTAGDPSHVLLVTPPDRVLLDFGAVDPADLDPAKLARDCEIIRCAALADPDALRRIVAALRPDATRAEQEAAVQAAERLGLTEAAAADAGGGLLGVVVIVGACLFASCFTAHCKSKQEETTPPDSPGQPPPK